MLAALIPVVILCAPRIQEHQHEEVLVSPKAVFAGVYLSKLKMRTQLLWGEELVDARVPGAGRPLNREALPWILRLVQLADQPGALAAEQTLRAPTDSAQDAFAGALVLWGRGLSAPRASLLRKPLFKEALAGFRRVTSDPGPLDEDLLAFSRLGEGKLTAVLNGTDEKLEEVYRAYREKRPFIAMSALFAEAEEILNRGFEPDRATSLLAKIKTEFKDLPSWDTYLLASLGKVRKRYSDRSETVAFLERGDRLTAAVVDRILDLTLTRGLRFDPANDLLVKAPKDAELRFAEASELQVKSDDRSLVQYLLGLPEGLSPYAVLEADKEEIHLTDYGFEDVKRDSLAGGAAAADLESKGATVVWPMRHRRREYWSESAGEWKKDVGDEFLAVVKLKGLRAGVDVIGQRLADGSFSWRPSDAGSALSLTAVVPVQGEYNNAVVELRLANRSSVPRKIQPFVVGDNLFVDAVRGSGGALRLQGALTDRATPPKEMTLQPGQVYTYQLRWSRSFADLAAAVEASLLFAYVPSDAEPAVLSNSLSVRLGARGFAVDGSSPSWSEGIRLQRRGRAEWLRAFLGDQ